MSKCRKCNGTGLIKVAGEGECQGCDGTGFEAELSIPRKRKTCKYWEGLEDKEAISFSNPEGICNFDILRWLFLPILNLNINRQINKSDCFNCPCWKEREDGV
ncbi:MAG TPA: hypothetical protein ENI23_06275 [bacterium]|nr:hypothetical protein [bacterium]